MNSTGVITWRPRDTGYGVHGQDGYLGTLKTPVWTIGWMGGKDESKRYYLTCYLPGIRRTWRGASEAKLKGVARRQLDVFLTRADETPESDPP